MNLEDIYRNIDNGEYRSQLPYPTRPVKPGTHMRVSELSPEALAALPALFAQYEYDLAAYRVARDAYDADDTARLDRFWSDLAEATGMTEHPKRTKLEGMAWASEYSGGLKDVVSAYLDYMELLQ